MLNILTHEVIKEEQKKLHVTQEKTTTTWWLVANKFFLTLTARTLRQIDPEPVSSFIYRRESLKKYLR